MLLIQNLPNNPLDIVGDIHGEIDALNVLLKHLGYNENGSHPDDRKLVFVGDLIDRGPDSYTVVRKVQQLVQAGQAYAILGNHEINLLIDDVKDGSGWFFPERYVQDLAFYAPFRQTPKGEHQEIRDFFNHLPIVLHRPDIRIVHAAWTRAAIEAIQSESAGTVSEYYEIWDRRAQTGAEASGLYQRYLEEKRLWDRDLDDGSKEPPLLVNIAEYEATQQMVNPIKVLTSGVEAPAESPFFAGNRWRFSDRVKWWDDYDDSVPVVIGHYWRLFRMQTSANTPRYTQLFNHIPPTAWHGRRGNVMCIDYSAGARWRDRQAKRSAENPRFRLAALRWPENKLVFDTGDVVPTTGFGQYS